MTGGLAVAQCAPGIERCLVHVCLYGQSERLGLDTPASKPCGGYRSSGIAAYPGSNLAAATVISPEHRRFTATRAKRLRLLQQRGYPSTAAATWQQCHGQRNIQWNSKAGSLQDPRLCEPRSGFSPPWRTLRTSPIRQDARCKTNTSSRARMPRSNHSIASMQAKLAALGFELEECSWLNPVDNVWSVHVRNRECPLMFTNGKGATKLAAHGQRAGRVFRAPVLQLFLDPLLPRRDRSPTATSPITRANAGFQSPTKRGRPDC